MVIHDYTTQIWYANYDKSIDYDSKMYIDIEWFEPFMYEHEKIVEHECKRSKGTDTHSEVKLKIRADMSSIMNS